MEEDIFNLLLSKTDSISQFWPDDYECYYAKVNLDNKNYLIYSGYDAKNRIITTGYHKEHSNSPKMLRDKLFGTNWIFIDGKYKESHNWKLIDNKKSCDIFMSFRSQFGINNSSSTLNKDYLNKEQLKNVDLNHLYIKIQQEYSEINQYKSGGDNKCRKETWAIYKIFEGDKEIRSPYIEIHLPKDEMLNSYSNSYYSPLQDNKYEIQKIEIDDQLTQKVRSIISNYSK